MHYLFVIDTEDYAGNFEREMCAYLTGRVGECLVGRDMAELFTEETGLEAFENVFDLPDEHGCHRPAAIHVTPGGRDYNSVAIAFKTRPTDDQVKLMKERALAFAALPAKTYGGPPRGSQVSKVTGFRLVREEKVETEEVL